MGFMNVICLLLYDAWPGFQDWLKEKYILRHGYHGKVFADKLLNYKFLIDLSFVIYINFL